MLFVIVEKYINIQKKKQLLSFNYFRHFLEFYLGICRFMHHVYVNFNIESFGISEEDNLIIIMINDY